MTFLKVVLLAILASFAVAHIPLEALTADDECLAGNSDCALSALQHSANELTLDQGSQDGGSSGNVRSMEVDFLGEFMERVVKASQLAAEERAAAAEQAQEGAQGFPDFGGIVSAAKDAVEGAVSQVKDTAAKAVDAAGKIAKETSITDLGKKVASAVDGAVKQVEAAAEAVTHEAVKKFEDAANETAEVASTASGVVQKVVETAKAVTQDVVAKVEVAANKTAEVASAASDIAEKVVEKAVEKAQDTVKKVADVAGNLTNITEKVSVKDIEKSIDGVIDGTLKQVEAAAEAVTKDAVAKVEDAANKTAEVASSAAGAVQHVAEQAKDAAAKVVDVAGNVTASTKKESVKAVGNHVENIIEGAVRQVEAAAEAVTHDVVAQVAGAAAGAVKEAQDIVHKVADAAANLTNFTNKVSSKDIKNHVDSVMEEVKAAAEAVSEKMQAIHAGANVTVTKSGSIQVEIDVDDAPGTADQQPANTSQAKKVKRAQNTTQADATSEDTQVAAEQNSGCRATTAAATVLAMLATLAA